MRMLEVRNGDDDDSVNSRYNLAVLILCKAIEKEFPAKPKRLDIGL